MSTPANAIPPVPGRSSFRLARQLSIRVTAVFLVCAAVAILAIGAIASILFGPFGEVNLEFTDLSGEEASQRLAREWPAGIDTAEVQKVSRKYESTIDSHSSWYRIGISPEAAATWRDDIHLKEEQCYDFGLSHLDKGIEGVHRIVSGPPPMHRQTGTTPAWWSPPAIDFRATELMKWYRNYDSGVGRATYSGYDESTNTLWVYEYSAQHDLLWTSGNVPVGRQFSTINQSLRKSPEDDIPQSDDTDVKE
jgi:hypothetical protein